MADEPYEEIELVYLTLGDVLDLYGLIIGCTATQAADQLRKPSENGTRALPSDSLDRDRSRALRENGERR